MLQITPVSLCFSLFLFFKISKCFKMLQNASNSQKFALELLRNYFKIALKCFIMLQITSVSLCFSLFLSVSKSQNASTCFKMLQILKTCLKLAPKLLQTYFKMLYFFKLLQHTSNCFEMLQNA